MNAKKHAALEEIPVQIMTDKLAKEANAPVSPAFEILAIKELTEALAVRAGKESQ